MLYSQIRSAVGRPFSPSGLLDAETHAGNMFCMEVQRLFPNYLHENDHECILMYRRGAFSYREAYIIGCDMVERFAALSRQPTHRAPQEKPGEVSKRPLGEYQQFLKRNVQFLTNELGHLVNTHKDQIGLFRQILVDFTYLKEIVKKGGETDLVKLNQILLGLRRLQKELDTTNTMIQERTLDLQPFMMLKNKIDSEEPCIEDLMDLDGNLFSPKSTSTQGINIYRKAYDFYLAYVDKILDPNFLYCTKFLSAIHRCREDVLEFRRSNGPSRPDAPYTDALVDPLPAPQTAHENGTLPNDQ